MSIVTWDKEPDTSGDICLDQEILITLLKMPPKELSERWKGKWVSGFISRVVLRKTVNGSNIVIEIRNHYKKYATAKQLMIKMSMNGPATFTVDQQKIMDLSIREGTQVYMNKIK